MHSFVVEDLTADTAVVADAYQNVTAWGVARPGTWTVPLEVIATATEGADGPGVRWATLAEAAPPAPPPAPAQIEANTAAILEAGRAGRFEHFTQAYARACARPTTDWPAPAAELATQTWLLARSRALHQIWLAETAARTGAPGLADAAQRFADTVVTGWQRAATSAYVLLRRGRAGPAVAAGMANVLTAACDAEQDLAHRLRRGAGGGDVDP
jgi:hypothetical protein